jgi:hypothetical protein
MTERINHLFLEEYGRRTETVIQTMAKKHAEGKARSSILFDKDEMLVNTVESHVAYINRVAERLARRRGITLLLPSYDEVIKRGGTGMYAELFGMDKQAWERLHELERATRAVNYGAQPYVPDLQARVAHIETQSDLLGYLSATPIGYETRGRRAYDSQKYVEADLYDRLGLPREPVVLRPATIAASEAGPWKAHFIEPIRAANPQKPVILLDDSLSTAALFAQINSQRGPGEVPVCQIVMADGSLTKPKIETGQFAANPELGIYIATWDQVPEVIDQINTQWNPQK